MFKLQFMFQKLRGNLTLLVQPNCAGGNAMFPRSSSLGTANNCARVTISCPERGDTAGKLVVLPGSLQELLNLGSQKFGFRATKILTKDGYLIEDFAVVRDGDHLILASEGGSESSPISSPLLL